MFSFILIYALIPLVVGIIGAVIADSITGQAEPGTKRRIVIAVLSGVTVALLSIIILFLFTPPYRLTGFNWCQTQNQSVRIDGRLIDRYGKGVSGETLQIRIFPAGGDENSALEDAVFATTAADGRLSVEVQQSNTWSRAGGKYVINFVYWYQNPLLGNE